jgi:hypothetical protein
MSTNIERYAGVCIFKSSGSSIAFAKILPLYSVHFSPFRTLKPFEQEREPKFPNAGLIFWKLPHRHDAEWDGVYEFGIEQSPDHYGSNDRGKEWFQVKNSDSIDTFDEFREHPQLLRRWRCAKTVYIRLGKWVYGPYSVAKCNLVDSSYDISFEPCDEKRFRRFTCDVFAQYSKMFPITAG